MKNEFKKLIDLVSDEENITKDEIINLRTNPAIRCRNIITYILYINYGFTFREIGMMIDKTPSAISKAFNRYANNLDEYEKKNIKLITCKLKELLRDA